jgi:hypothetical protein
MMIEYYEELMQGSEEWLEARRGILTASEMKLIITPANLKPASNDKERAHVYELAAQRISGFVEPHYISEDMMRGNDDEVYARALYADKYAPVTEMGFMTNDKWGFKIGYSPDGLVGDDGLIECKSRRQKYQIETIVKQEVPAEYVIQLQTGLLVSERKWIDFISYSGGLPMFVQRVYPDPFVQEAIVVAATGFNERVAANIATYNQLASKYHMTERTVEKEIE